MFQAAVCPAVGEWRYGMPSANRRKLLFLLATIVGLGIALFLPSVVLWKKGAVIAMGLAFVAGASALWSP